MKVHELMTKTVRTLSSHEQVLDAEKMMNDFNVSSIPIISDQHKAIGIITRSDLNILPNKQIHLSQLCQRGVISIEKDSSLDAAVELMKKHMIHHLLVTDNHGEVEGILSSFDFLDLIKI